MPREMDGLVTAKDGCQGIVCIILKEKCLNCRRCIRLFGVVLIGPRGWRPVHNPANICLRCAGNVQGDDWFRLIRYANRRPSRAQYQENVRLRSLADDVEWMTTYPEMAGVAKAIMSTAPEREEG